MEIFGIMVKQNLKIKSNYTLLKFKRFYRVFIGIKRLKKRRTFGVLIFILIYFFIQTAVA